MNSAKVDKILNCITLYITENFSSSEKILIALDGRCAAGKTTLAALLQEKWNANLLHMDDFFLRPEQRTKERLAQPGGNVDYERFEAEVLKPLSENIEFDFSPFDCTSMQLGEGKRIVPKRITIIEGSYACHPKLQKYYDVKIFLTVSPEEQKKRVLNRNGSEKLRIFLEKWIPMEELYFETYGVEKQCDLCFLNE